MSEWGDWCRMREKVTCKRRGCSGRAYADTGLCASHDPGVIQSKKENPELWGLSSTS